MPRLNRDQLLDLLAQAAEICTQKDKSDNDIYGTSPEWSYVPVIPQWVRGKIPGVMVLTWGDIHETLNGGSSRPSISVGESSGGRQEA